MSDMVRRHTRAELAEQVAGFVSRITPTDARWQYAMEACTYEYKGEPNFCDTAARAVGRIVGHDLRGVSLRLMTIRKHGSIGAAREWFAQRPFWGSHDPYAVPALEPWHIGHVYFARLYKYPHLFKVGFTRRLHERIEDIESKSKVQIGEVRTLVGTMADEALWHRKLRDTRVSGEWFFDPLKSERGLPDFLVKSEAA